MSSCRHPAIAAALALAVAATACGRARGGLPGGAPEPETRRDVPAPPDPVEVYRRLGLIAHGGALPLTGRVAYLGGATADTTFAVLTLALPSRGLSFTHTGADYRASYRVDADVRADAATGTASPPVATIAAAESVVVATFRETTRDDETVLFQQVLRLAPGQYRLALRVRDGGSLRAVADTSTLRVPRLAAGAVAAPVPFYELVVRGDRAASPRLVASPRATVTFGRDSTLALYLEAYGADADVGRAGPATDAGDVALRVLVRTEDGSATWQDTVALDRGAGLAAGIVHVPVTYLGIGPATVEVARLGGAAGARDTARAPVFVSFGEALPAATFEDMLSYLRFYTSAARIDRLRRAAPGDRAAAWSAFLLATDPDPALAGHQGLQEYFARLQVANQRYRSEAGPGWLTDRGMVFAALGDPDQVYEPTLTALGDRNRVQVWIFREARVQLEFRDRSGFDRWELTPTARAEFLGALAALHP